MKGKGVYMQVNSVSLASQSFEGKKTAQPKRVEITPEKFANMSDSDLKILAQITASNQVNDKKHRKLNKAMFAMLPITGGLVTMAAMKNPSRLGRLGALFAGSWAMVAGLFVVDKLLDGKHALERKFPKLRQFRDNHPILSLGATLTGVSVALSLGGRGIAKAADKVLPKFEASKLYAKYAPKVNKQLTKLSNHLDNNFILNGISKALKKVPSSIKSIAGKVAEYSPIALAIGIVGHSLNHSAVRNRVAMDNFVELKNAQDDVRAQLEEKEFNQPVI